MRTALGLAVVVAALAACGSDDDKPRSAADRFSGEERRAARVLIEFNDALRKRDVNAVCRKSAVEPFEEDAKEHEECLRRSREQLAAVGQVKRPSIRSITIKENVALIRVGKRINGAWKGSTVFMIKLGDDWKVDLTERA